MKSYSVLRKAGLLPVALAAGMGFYADSAEAQVRATQRHPYTSGAPAGPRTMAMPRAPVMQPGAGLPRGNVAQLNSPNYSTARPMPGRTGTAGAPAYSGLPPARASSSMVQTPNGAMFDRRAKHVPRQSGYRGRGGFAAGGAIAYDNWFASFGFGTNPFFLDFAFLNRSVFFDAIYLRRGFPIVCGFPWSGAIFHPLYNFNYFLYNGCAFPCAPQFRELYVSNYGDARTFDYLTEQNMELLNDNRDLWERLLEETEKRARLEGREAERKEREPRPRVNVEAARTDTEKCYLTYPPDRIYTRDQIDNVMTDLINGCVERMMIKKGKKSIFATDNASASAIMLWDRETGKYLGKIEYGEWLRADKPEDRPASVLVEQTLEGVKRIRADAVEGITPDMMVYSPPHRMR